jgi:hypothetical protein
MKRSLLAPSQSARLESRTSVFLPSVRFSPLLFLLTGFTWLLVASLLGIAIMIALIHGTPLPHWLKAIHVHGTLVGGLLQVATGGYLLSRTQRADHKPAYAGSHAPLFLIVNGAAVGLVVSFSVGNMAIAGVAGLLLLATLLSLSPAAWIHFRHALNKPAGAAWVYRAAVVALLLGLAAGVMMAFRVADAYYIHLRLLHIHFIVLGFLAVVCIVALHQIVPALAQQPLPATPLVRVALWSLPVAFAVLLTGFMTSSLLLEIAMGCLLVVVIGFCAYTLTAAWIRSRLPGNAASDHLLIGISFLLLAAAAGVAMGTNYLRNPPFLPIGSLHVVAYTHLAFIGCMMQVVCGSLSFYVPSILTVTRVPNTKKRDAYRAQLDNVMNRWRAAQLTGMSVGTMALAVLASLTWSLPLGSPYVQATAWFASGLLIGSLTLFAVKLAWAVGLRPS